MLYDTFLFDVLDNDGALTKMLQAVLNENISIKYLRMLNEYHPRSAVHSVRVAVLSGVLAQGLGFSDNNVRTTILTGLLHDIGKLDIDLNILNKPSTLTRQELATIKIHPIHSFIRLKSEDVSVVVRYGVLMHHERLDGKGYPLNLPEGAINFCSRIVAISDVFEALTAKRAYKDGYTVSDSMEIMTQDKGHFDAVFLDYFKHCIK